MKRSSALSSCTPRGSHHKHWFLSRTFPAYTIRETQISRLINKKWLNNDIFNSLLLALSYLIYIRHVFVAVHKQVYCGCQHLHFVILCKCAIIYLTSVPQATI